MARTRIATATAVRTRAPKVIRIVTSTRNARRIKIRNDRRIRIGSGKMIKSTQRTARRTRTGRIVTRKSPVVAVRTRIVTSIRAVLRLPAIRTGTERRTSTRAVAAAARTKTNIPAVVVARTKTGIERIAIAATNIRRRRIRIARRRKKLRSLNR